MGEDRKSSVQQVYPTLCVSDLKSVPRALIAAPKTPHDTRRACGEPACPNEWSQPCARPWRRDDRTRAATSAFGTKRTNWAGLAMSVHRGRPEVAGMGQNDAFGRVEMWRGGFR